MTNNYFDKYTTDEVKIGNYFVKMINKSLEYRKNNAITVTDIDGTCNGVNIELQELSHNGAISDNNIIIDTISTFQFKDKNLDKNISFSNPNINIGKYGKLFTLSDDDLYLVHFKGSNDFSDIFKFNIEEEIRFLYSILSPQLDFDLILQEYNNDFRICLQILYKPLLEKIKSQKNINIFQNSLNKNSNIEQILSSFQIVLNIPQRTNFIPINVKKLKEYFFNNYVPMKRNNKKKYNIDDNWESAFSVLNLGIILREELYYTQSELSDKFLLNNYQMEQQNISNIRNNSQNNKI